VHSRLWNAAASSITATAGRQLFLHDTFRDTSRPILSVMADPKTVFVRGLRRFRRLTTYGNIVNDRAVVWYTTAFSPTDPYADLKKVQVHYVKGYEGVVLERGGGVVLREASEQEDRRRHRVKEIVAKRTDEAGGDKAGDDSDENDKEEAEQVFDSKWPWSQRLRVMAFGLTLFTLWPLYIPVLGVSVTAAAVMSEKRMRRHDRGEDGVDTASYRSLELWSTDEEEEPTSTTTASQEPRLSEADASDSSSSPSSPNKEGETTAPLSQVFPALDLLPAQLDMIRGLNALPWRKYPVWIRRHINPHEDIVIRGSESETSEGLVVLKHFAAEEFLV